MNLVDFLAHNDIQYMPAKIMVIKDSDTKKIKNKAPVKYKEINEYPKNIDFTGGHDKKLNIMVERKPDSVFAERKKLINNYKQLCIDTCFIHQIDVDFKEDKYDQYSIESKQFVDDLCSYAPYFKSMTKKHGKHIFFKTDKPLKDLGYSGKPVLIYEDIEVLSGMWSYADKLQMVVNADNEIPYFNIEKYIKDPPKKQCTKKHRSKLNNSVTENNNIVLKMDQSWTNNKKCIYELSENLSAEYYTDYDKWCRVIWSLANFDEDLYDIAQHISKKCPEKFDANALKNLWTNATSGSTIGTYYYYCKKSNIEQYYKIKCKYFLLDNDLDYLSTDDCLADVFLENQGINYVAKTLEGKLSLYNYDGNVWSQDTNQYHKLNNNVRQEIRSWLYKLLDALILKYDKQLNETEDKKQKEYLEKQKAFSIKFINEIILKICNAAKVKGVVDVFIQKLSALDFSHVDFDNNGYLFTFKNKCFCLKEFKQITTNREDYILTTTGYAHEESSQESLHELDALLDSIFPNKEVKDHYLKVMCSSLYGVRLEKFFIANGNGGNGKGVINELLGDTLGNYYYKGNSESFTKPLKEGNNPQIANMHNKRLVVIQEIESDNKRLNGTVIKELTGGNKINSRANYSNVTQITILATFILECNKKAKIDGRIDESYQRRLDDIPFESTFTTNKQLLESGLENVYHANTYYKEQSFRDKFKNVLFNYLFNYMKEYKQQTDKLVVHGWTSPKIVLDRTAEYLESSDEVKEWFNTIYEPKINDYKTIKDKVANYCFIECKDVYESYKHSNYYSLLTKKQKREQNLKWFYNYMQENINFKVYYKEKYTLDNKTYRHLLLDHKVSNLEYAEYPEI